MGAAAATANPSSFISSSAIGGSGSSFPSSSAPGGASNGYSPPLSAPPNYQLTSLSSNLVRLLQVEFERVRKDKSRVYLTLNEMLRFQLPSSIGLSLDLTSLSMLYTIDRHSLGIFTLKDISNFISLCLTKQKQFFAGAANIPSGMNPSSATSPSSSTTSSSTSSLSSLSEWTSRMEAWCSLHVYHHACLYGAAHVEDWLLRLALSCSYLIRVPSAALSHITFLTRDAVKPLFDCLRALFPSPSFSFQNFFDLLQFIGEQSALLSLDDPNLDEYVPVSVLKLFLHFFVKGWIQMFIDVGFSFPNRPQQMHYTRLKAKENLSASLEKERERERGEKRSALNMILNASQSLASQTLGNVTATDKRTRKAAQPRTLTSNPNSATANAAAAAGVDLSLADEKTDMENVGFGSAGAARRMSLSATMSAVSLRQYSLGDPQNAFEDSQLNVIASANLSGAASGRGGAAAGAGPSLVIDTIHEYEKKSEKRSPHPLGDSLDKKSTGVGSALAVAAAAVAAKRAAFSSSGEREVYSHSQSTDSESTAAPRDAVALGRLPSPASGALSEEEETKEKERERETKEKEKKTGGVGSIPVILETLVSTAATKSSPALTTSSRIHRPAKLADKSSTSTSAASAAAGGHHLAPAASSAVPSSATSSVPGSAAGSASSSFRSYQSMSHKPLGLGMGLALGAAVGPSAARAKTNKAGHLYYVPAHLSQSINAASMLSSAVSEPVATVTSVSQSTSALPGTLHQPKPSNSFLNPSATLSLASLLSLPLRTEPAAASTAQQRDLKSSSSAPSLGIGAASTSLPNSPKAVALRSIDSKASGAGGLLDPMALLEKNGKVRSVSTSLGGGSGSGSSSSGSGGRNRNRGRSREEKGGGDKGHGHRGLGSKRSKSVHFVESDSNLNELAVEARRELNL